MAGINYASKYSDKVDELFEKRPRSIPAVNNDYDFDGVDKVIVYSYPIADLNDYSRSGTNRYGEAQELEDEVQTMELTQDKSFTFTIDRANRDDRMMTAEAGKRLAVQINQSVIPFVDKFRFMKMAMNAGSKVDVAQPITEDNAWQIVCAVMAEMDENDVPEEGRLLYVTPQFQNLIKDNISFIQANNNTTDISRTGYIGDVDGARVMKMPSKYFSLRLPFFITMSIACPSPTKLTDYIIHNNPPGLNGWLVEGRVRFDAFVLNNKKYAIGIPVIPQLLIEAYTGNENLFGLNANDLQRQAWVINDTLYSKALYIPEDSAFYSTAGYDPAQGTHFIVLHATPKATDNSIKVTFNGATQTLDADGILIIQVTDIKKNLKVSYVEKNGANVVDKYDVSLKGVTLLKKGQVR